ncbi:hypothetical protein DASC09_019610 [Saccharomycopsis crataegensis]|uniref:Uncharacterized protein n=1 Tax=Saccharomycopsis crataegensis TaxID=43959 RepID=A0AAV5QJ38_9ASCO|nr:hypothetical protein DASC09_019610 [Saccharomycopsis crataegensis]
MPGNNTSFNESSNSKRLQLPSNTHGLSPIANKPLSSLAAPTLTSTGLYPDLKTDITKLKERISPIRRIPTDYGMNREKSINIDKPPIRLSPVRKLGTPKRSPDRNNKGLRFVNPRDTFGITQSVDRRGVTRTLALSNFDTSNLFNSGGPGDMKFTRIANRVSHRSPKGSLDKPRATPHSESRVSKRLSSRLTASMMTSTKFKDLYANLKHPAAFDGGVATTTLTGGGSSGMISASSIFGSPISARSTSQKSGSNNLLSKLKSSSVSPPSYSRPTASSLLRSSEELVNFKDNNFDDKISPTKIHELNNQRKKNELLQSKIPKLKSCLKTKLASANRVFSIVNERNDQENNKGIELGRNVGNKENDSQCLYPGDNSNNNSDMSMIQDDLSDSPKFQTSVASEQQQLKKRKSVKFDSNVEELNQDNSITKRKRSEAGEDDDTIKIVEEVEADHQDKHCKPSETLKKEIVTSPVAKINLAKNTVANNKPDEEKSRGKIFIQRLRVEQKLDALTKNQDIIMEQMRSIENEIKAFKNQASLLFDRYDKVKEAEISIQKDILVLNREISQSLSK